MAISSAQYAIGLEIDTGIVRAVSAAGSPSSPSLLNLAGAKLADGAVEEGIVVQPQAVGEALRQLWSRGPMKSRNVLLGVSNQGVLVRYATIPKVPKDKLDNVVRFQAQENLPVPLESVVLDYMIIGETEGEEENKLLEVLLVAARRDMLNGFLEALDYAKLEAADIDASTLTLMRTLPGSALQHTVAVVNVANGLSNILVSDKGSPRMARLVSVKLKDIADLFGCSLKDVVSVANLQDAQYQGAYTAWVSSLLNEIRSSLTYYQNLEGSATLEAIILNGRGALLKGLSGQIQEALGLPVRVINPFQSFANAEKKIRSSGITTVEYAICAGLARRGLEG